MAGTLDQNDDDLFRNPPGTPKITFEDLRGHPDTKGWVVCKSKDGLDHVGGTNERGGVVWLEDEQIPRALAFLTASKSSGQ